MFLRSFLLDSLEIQKDFKKKIIKFFNRNLFVEFNPENYIMKSTLRVFEIKLFLNFNYFFQPKNLQIVAKYLPYRSKS